MKANADAIAGGGTGSKGGGGTVGGIGSLGGGGKSKGASRLRGHVAVPAPRVRGALAAAIVRRVVRGRLKTKGDSVLSVASRHSMAPHEVDEHLGFRCAIGGEDLAKLPD